MTWRFPVACLCVAGAIAIARPWTVRPIEDHGQPAFDAESYVSSIWAARVVPEATATAVDISTLAPTGIPTGRTSIFVEGTGTVAAVDVRSRAGVAHLTFGRGIEADLQIGPVLRGTAIRDALSFIHFSDFTNQIDYATVASALNARVVEGPLKTVEPDRLTGRTVHVLGALSSSSGRLSLTPIALELRGDAK